MIQQNSETTHHRIDDIFHGGREELERRLSVIKLQLDFKKCFSDLLECPVCLEQCTDSPFVCSYGHLICGGCKTRGILNRCPTCRNHNLQRLVKFSELVENYGSLPCPQGCGHLAADEIERMKHIQTCLSIWVKCPVTSCSTKGPSLDLRHHLIHEHPEICYSFGTRMTVELNGEPDNKTSFLLGVENIIMLQFKQDSGIKCSAVHLKSGNENSCVELVFRNYIKNTTKVKKILIPVLNEQAHGKIFTSSYMSMVDFIQTGEGTLSLTVNISISKVTEVVTEIIKQDQCNHGKRRCLLVCPDLSCNKPVPCQACHDENTEDHCIDIAKLREIICPKCSFVQIPGQKCVSCNKVLN